MFLDTRSYLRNKSWKPECVGSFNINWRILVFYPEPEAIRSDKKTLFEFGFCVTINPSSHELFTEYTLRGIKLTNIRQSMLKLKAHSGFHDSFRF